MDTPARTAEGKWVLFERSTGRRFERWPVDARAMLAGGELVSDPAECEAPAEQAPEPEAVKPPMTEHPLGVPLVVTKSHNAEPAKPMLLPKGRRK